MRTVKVIGLVLVLLISAASFALAEWSGADADQYISYLPSAAKVYAPTIAFAPNGDIYSAWVQGYGLTPYEIYFSKSTDNGATWSGSSTDQRISANDGDPVYSGGIYGSRRIDMAVDSEGRIFVVWPENYVSANFDTTCEIMMVMSTDQGATWIHSDTDFPISDTLTTETANAPNIAIDANDVIYVVWNQSEPVTGKAEIYYSFSNDHGATWSAQNGDRFISYANNYSSSSPDIAVDPDGFIHVVWREYISSTDYKIQYGVSLNGGDTFSSENADSILATAPYNIVFPRIAAGPGSGDVHIIYASDDTARYVGTTDGGANWTQSMVYGGSDYGMYTPDIAVLSTGTLIAIIDEEYPGETHNRQVWASYSVDNGANWSVTLDPVSNYDDTQTYDRAYVPTIVVSADDVMYVTYLTNYPSNSNSYQEMCFSKSDSMGTSPGVLSGDVTELDGTTPIEGVIIRVNDGSSDVAFDTTSETGHFVFPLDAGTYSIYFSKYTHHDSSHTGLAVVENTVTDASISLRPVTQGTIGGQVFEQTGTFPLEGVIVEAYDQSHDLWATDTTDNMGDYELSLYPETYDIEFSVDLFRDTTVADQVVVEAGSVTLDVNMTWAIPADDVGPISLDEPSPHMYIDQPYTPMLTIENFGYQDQIVDLNLVIEDGSMLEVYNETYTGITVDSLGLAQVAFLTDFIPEFSGPYTFTATTINPDDEVAANDEMEFVVVCYQHQGFGGPDNYGYFYRDNTAPCGPEFNWIDISTTGTQIEPTEHYFMSDPLPIGFNFEYYGHSYDTMWVNSHGSVHVGVRDVWLMSNDCPLPDPSTPNASMILVFWDSKVVRYEDGQGVYYQTFDDPSVDYTIIQWNVSAYGEEDDQEFQVILYADGRIVYQYNNVTENLANGQGQEASIGLEYDVEPEFYGISYHCDDDNPANRLTDGLAIEWLKDIGTTGSITGIVTDASTTLPLSGVYVEAVGLEIGDYTNTNGEYTLPNLYACGYDVSFSLADYNDTTVYDVTVTPGTPYNLNVALEPEQHGYQYLPGDANMPAGLWPPSVIGGDVTYLVNYFRGMVPPCMLEGFYASADANGSCSITGGDVTYLVGFFRGFSILSHCVDYPTFWPPAPDTEPDGWPNCDEIILNDNSTPASSNSK